MHDRYERRHCASRFGRSSRDFLLDTIAALKHLIYIYRSLSRFRRAVREWNRCCACCLGSFRISRLNFLSLSKSAIGRKSLAERGHSALTYV
jgi:hypothetical protein